MIFINFIHLAYFHSCAQMNRHSRKTISIFGFYSRLINPSAMKFPLIPPQTAGIQIGQRLLSITSAPITAFDVRHFDVRKTNRKFVVNQFNCAVHACARERTLSQHCKEHTYKTPKFVSTPNVRIALAVVHRPAYTLARTNSAFYSLVREQSKQPLLVTLIHTASHTAK